MSDALDKIITTPDHAKGNLEYAIALLWEETDREKIADLAAVELSELRFLVSAQDAMLKQAMEIITECNATNEAADGEGYGAWSINSDLQHKIDLWIMAEKEK